MQHSGGIFRDLDWSGIWPPHSLFAEQPQSTITGTLIANPINLSFKKVSIIIIISLEKSMNCNFL